MSKLIGIHTVIIDPNDDLVKDDTVYGELEGYSLTEMRDLLSVKLDNGVKSNVVDSYTLVVFDIKEAISQSNDDNEKDKKL